ncbi:MAG: hypothetical protein SF172_08280 [Burkholderiales bacterium]|nr:hypothetical protein [Burkholderiales bacterium]
MADDWFRNSVWDEETARIFYTKLARAKSQRDQYLVIQAITLVDRHPEVTLSLVEEYFKTRRECYHDARAHSARAEAHLKLGDVRAAIAAMKAAMLAEAANPGFRTSCFVDLPYLIARESIREEYPYAIQTLSTHPVDDSEPPIHKFKWHAAKSVLSLDGGNPETVRHHAKLALACAQQRRPWFTLRAKLGLVESEHDKMIKRLREIQR